MLESLIGITGRRGSGKDTAAQVLIDAGYDRLKMAHGLKVMLKAFFVECYGMSEGAADHLLEDQRMKNNPIQELGGATPRFLMQTLGTEWGRRLVHDDIWVDAFRNAARRRERVVVTDVRFLNEARVIKEMGGVIVRVNADDRLGPNKDLHPSEQEMAQIEADWTVFNNKSPDLMQASVRRQFLQGNL